MKTAYVLGGVNNGNFLPSRYSNIVSIQWLVEFPEKDTPVPDLILFCGGGDLVPSTYDENYPFISGNIHRDMWEENWFNWAVKNKIPMFGICRGMQLFTALTGGKLIPHVDGHYGHHAVEISSTEPGQGFNVNSIHHQMCEPDWAQTELLAWARNIAFQETIEPEALFFKEVRALGVQWHPEMMSTNTKATQKVLEWVDKYLL